MYISRSLTINQAGENTNLYNHKESCDNRTVRLSQFTIGPVCDLLSIVWPSVFYVPISYEHEELHTVVNESCTKCNTSSPSSWGNSPKAEDDELIVFICNGQDSYYFI